MATEDGEMLQSNVTAELIERAGKEPIGCDISDYSDEFCAGFLAGQKSVLEELTRCGCAGGLGNCESPMSCFGVHA